MKYLVVDKECGCNYVSNKLTNDMIMRVREGRFVIVNVESERQTSCNSFESEIKWTEITRY